MSAELWLAYVATVLVLMSTPGPSQLLMLSNSLSHGLRPALATAAGDLSANLLQMLAAGLGLAALVIASESAFIAIKWAGVAYLLLLGVRMLRARTAPVARSRAARPLLRRLWLQGFVTSAANPKAVVFFAALFPQFIDPARPLAGQLAVLAATYLLIDGCFLSAYGAGSNWIAARLAARANAWLQRAGGALMIGAALLLGLKSLPRET